MVKYRIRRRIQSIPAQILSDSVSDGAMVSRGTQDQGTSRRNWVRRRATQSPTRRDRLPMPASSGESSGGVCSSLAFSLAARAAFSSSIWDSSYGCQCACFHPDGLAGEMSHRRAFHRELGDGREVWNLLKFGVTAGVRDSEFQVHIPGAVREKFRKRACWFDVDPIPPALVEMSGVVTPQRVVSPHIDVEPCRLVSKQSRGSHPRSSQSS